MIADSDLNGSNSTGIAAAEAEEIKYLAQKYNITTEEVRRAIDAVGIERETLEEYLDDYKENSNTWD